MTAQSLIDGRGCLTEAGLAALRNAPPGRAAPELASHVASCPRCQERVLAIDAPLHARGKKTAAPSLGRTLLLMGVILVVIVLALATMRHLVGR